MKNCCQKYLDNCQPRKPLNTDFFTEDHLCSCGQKLRIKFQRVQFLGSDVEYVVVSVDLI